jgi:hypothetical protein
MRSSSSRLIGGFDPRQESPLGSENGIVWRRSPFGLEPSVPGVDSTGSPVAGQAEHVLCDEVEGELRPAALLPRRAHRRRLRGIERTPVSASRRPAPPSHRGRIRLELLAEDGQIIANGETTAELTPARVITVA